MIHPRAKLLADLRALGFLLQDDVDLDAGHQALVLSLLESIGNEVEQTSHKKYFNHELSFAVRSAIGQNFLLSSLRSALAKAGISDAEGYALQALRGCCRQSLEELRKDVMNEVVSTTQGNWS